jgi:hypothetical protein
VTRKSCNFARMYELMFGVNARTFLAVYLSWPM